MPHLQPAANVHVRRFDDDLVLLHLGAGVYYSLDPVGATIWEALALGHSVEETVGEVLRQYDVDEATARGDVQKLVADLVAAGLLEERSSALQQGPG
jgi:hypothetical protein